MITGRGSGTGKYSMHTRSSGNNRVVVARMPEDDYTVRIAFKHNEETAIPTIKLNDRYAEMLWVALNGMAKDLGWKDYELTE